MKHIPTGIKLATSIEISTTGCWVWTRSCNHGGYGLVAVNRKTYSAHRVSYEMHKGPIPEGLEIDHLCRVRNCINPDHLEAVTRYENLMRGQTPAATNAGKLYCVNGHKFTSTNTCINKKKRSCRECLHHNMKKYKIKVKQIRGKHEDSHGNNPGW